MADFKLSSAVLQALSAASQAVGRPIIRTDSADFHFPDETVLVSLSFTNLLVKSVRLVRSSAEADQVLTTESGSVVYVTAGLRLIDIARVFITSDSEQAASASVTLDLSYLTRRFSSPPIPIEWPAQKGERQILEFQSDRQDRRKELIAHLNANRVYYSNVIHQALDSGTIVAMLAEYSWNGKPLIDQVEPQPLTMAGNYLVFRAPVDPIEPSGVSENGKQKTWEELLEDRAITVGEQSADERLIPLPTAGVFAEAVLGRSNSAEKLDITRFWNWQDSPIPLTPTEIAPVATGSRATTEDLKPGQLGQPVLNIVNPPSLPNPAGLGAVLGAVSSGNMFRDMSGLAGTQGLVQTGMQETLQAATDAGQLASANMRTEAQKAVAMGQIAADIVKSVVGAGGSGSSVQGISGSGATINHGKSLDQRGVGAAGTSSGGGGPANLGGSSAESSDGGSSGGTAPGRGAGAAPGSTGGNEQAAFSRAVWGPAGDSPADLTQSLFQKVSSQSAIGAAPSTTQAREPTLDEIVGQLTPPFSSYADYFKALNRTTFFGIPVDHLHNDLIQLLSRVESKLITAGFTNSPPLIRSIGGGSQRGGLHTWGLAIDINSDTNPYVLGERRRDPADEACERAVDAETSEVYDYVAWFMLGKMTSAITAKIKNGVRDFKPPTIGGAYDELRQESDAMVTFFGFPDRQAVDRWINQNWSVLHPIPQAPSPSPDEVWQKISQFRAVLGAGPSPKPVQSVNCDRPFKAREPAKGFLDIPKQVVEFLAREGLTWGAVGFGAESGDIMHFDHRGASYRAIQSAKASAKMKISTQSLQDGSAGQSDELTQFV